MPHNVNWSRRLYRDVWACWTPCFLGKGKKEWKTGKKRAHESITPTGAPQAWHLHAVPAFGVYAPALRSLKNSISERGTQALSFDGWFSIHFQMDAGLSLRMDLAWKTQRMESDKSFMLYILTAVKSVKYAIDWGRGSRACQGLYWTAAFYWSQSLHPHYGQKRNCQFVCFFLYLFHACFGPHKFSYLHMNINEFNLNDAALQKTIQKTELPSTTASLTNASDCISLEYCILSRIFTSNSCIVQSLPSLYISSHFFSHSAELMQLHDACSLVFYSLIWFFLFFSRFFFLAPACMQGNYFLHSL